ncbi:DUF1127 domain-containing protein [Bradyrhizobium lablabi]|nr:DUF1127 domain-containing protein [Bradyrhizobium lablabi]
MATARRLMVGSHRSQNDGRIVHNASRRRSAEVATPASAVGAGKIIFRLRSHWQREREIRTAVMALARFDDKTLRYLGISSRSEIERVVRYCRDC